MKSILIAVILVAGGLMAAGCQSSDTNPSGGTPSSVGNGQTRNNGPFAPDSSPPTGATTQPSSHY